jgi:hypothetical protein
VAALSAELRLQTENGRSVVVAELVGERQPAGEALQLKQSEHRLTRTEEAQRPTTGFESFCSSEQHGETCGRDEARAGEVDAECCVGRNIGKPLRKRWSGVGVDLSDDAEKVGARFVDEQLSSHERRLARWRRFVLVG